MNNLITKKTKIMLGVMVGATLVMIALYVIMFIMIKNKTFAISQERHTMNAEFEKFYDISGQQRKFDSTQDLRAELQRALVTEEQAPQFFEAIETLADDARVTLEVLSVSAEKTLDMQIRVEGSFAEVYTFFIALEHMPYALDITRSSVGYIAPVRQRVTQAVSIPRVENNPGDENIEGEESEINIVEPEVVEEIDDTSWQGIFDITLTSFISE